MQCLWRKGANTTVTRQNCHQSTEASEVGKPRPGYFVLKHNNSSATVVVNIARFASKVGGETQQQQYNSSGAIAPFSSKIVRQRTTFARDSSSTILPRARTIYVVGLRLPRPWYDTKYYRAFLLDVRLGQKSARSL